MERIADKVLDALEAYYARPVKRRDSPWVFLREVQIGTGRRGRRGRQPKHVKQRMDAWAYNTWPSMREAVAYEVKTNRQDFTNELQKPEKRQAALLLSSRFYFITTPGVVADVTEIPEECGWILLQENGEMVGMKEAPLRELGSFPDYFVNSLIRRIARREKEEESNES